MYGVNTKEEQEKEPSRFLYLDWMAVRALQKKGEIKLIDLRSPKEFEQACIPRAINVAVLDNQERHEVGLLYKTEGKSKATAHGLELFAKKAEDFYSEIEKHSSSDKRIVVHCWRGGMRSRLVAEWLSVMGFKVSILKGGYKAFRQEILTHLTSLAKHPKIVFNGRTGAGKTAFLNELQDKGFPVIDLEGLASHRGSVFGHIGISKPSPSQQDFENELIDRYVDIKEKKPLLLELEHSIGPIHLPKELRLSLTGAPMVFLSRDLEDRINFLSEEYAHNWDASAEELFLERFKMLYKFFTLEQRSDIIASIKKKEFSKVISVLLQYRYDKAYDKSLERHKAQMRASFNLTHQYAAAVSYVEGIYL